jgi:GT2 family glycosyltransferase
MTANPSIIPVRLDKRAGFGAALEEGFNAGEANHVVFLHSDVYAENIYWLANLQRCLYELKDKGVKLVSARTNDPGSCVNYDPRLIGEADTNIGGDVVVDTPLPLFCALCHRELFKRIGGFVKNYPYAWYEDEELFWRMRYYKYHQAIASKSYVKHDGGVTIKSLLENSPKTLSVLEGNRELCAKDIRLYVNRKSPVANQKS